MTQPSPRATPPRLDQPRASSSARSLALLAWLIIAGIVLYLAIDVLLQLLPPHYNPLRVPESDFARGPYGWLMTVNFIVRGAFSLTLLAGIALSMPPAARSRAGLALLGVWGIGAFLLALFPADPYGAPATHIGAIHLLIALVAFGAIAVAELLLARSFTRDAAWQAYAPVATMLAVLAAIGACLVALPPLLFPHLAARIGGLTERIFLGFALLWMLAVAIWLLRLSRQQAGA
ncbi:MAG TPA: DUF998 domain-containing protein [Ktedonobacterales bacterium]